MFPTFSPTPLSTLHLSPDRGPQHVRLHSSRRSRPGDVPRGWTDERRRQTGSRFGDGRRRLGQPRPAQSRRPSPFSPGRRRRRANGVGATTAAAATTTPATTTGAASAPAARPCRRRRVGRRCSQRCRSVFIFVLELVLHLFTYQLPPLTPFLF